MSFRFDRTHNNLVLFALNFIYIFVIGYFENLGNPTMAYHIIITGIYLASYYSIRDKGNIMVSAPVIVIILTWISSIFHLGLLEIISVIVSLLFFLVIIFFLVIRVAKSKRVTRLEFLESINVYLLLGIEGSLLFRLVYIINHSAYNIPGETIHFSDFIYFSFVTMTTLGYGDITPVSPAARSLTIFFSVAGQLYLTMIIAVLVGKYLSMKND